ncbi:hypothetical protein TGAMA5MH_08624 [Trichoderma gamsii]|uniref:Uncharacterized protein n=1 Tax=Trichoderma gamsii TaxID=398673 RepID=A0A2K0T1L4_9HYPO|nr:hypothetical protein TGAMA5MH_08624 [Trichoderma gamsii]
MVDAARQIFESGSGLNSPPISSCEAYLYGMFGIRPNDGLLYDMDTVLVNTHEFLFGGTQPPGNTYKTHLFCNDNAFLKRSARQQAVQLNGQPATLNGQAVSVESLYAGPIADNTENGVYPDIFLLQLPASGNQAAMWQYYFFRAFDGQKICSGGVRAETFKAYINQTPVPVVVLCPASFTGGRTDTLGGIAPEPDPPNQQAVQAVSDVRPNSLTFLHELFHLCPWDPTTKSLDVIDNNYKGGDAYDVWDILTYPPAESTINAQNYAFFSLAAWYTLNKRVPDPRGNGQTVLITYANGYCDYIRGP